MTFTAPDPIPPDTRSIDDMPFGSGAADPVSTATAVRETLHQCGVTVAHEIEELGCTGASAKGLSPTQIGVLRLGLAGGGVGLTCFVPVTRYCLAHSTIGGLQIGQASRHPEEIMKISRELAPRERGQVELIEASRRVRGGDLHDRLLRTADALSGRDLPPGVESGDETDTGFEDGQPYQQVAEHSPILSDALPTGDAVDLFVCPEHNTPLWACRYCVAQMIVEGPLEPAFTVRFDGEDDYHRHDFVDVPPLRIISDVCELDLKGIGRVDVYARVATFRRKLARD